MNQSDTPGDMPIKKEPHIIVRCLGPFASMKLTVVLLLLAIFLVFAGTLAQVHNGNWIVVNSYFHSFFVKIPFSIFFSRNYLKLHEIPGYIPFPGGYSIGGLLLINLMVLHAIHFKVTARGGRLIAGLIVLVFGVGLTWFVITEVVGKDLSAVKDDPFWRVLKHLIKGGGAGLVLYVGCFFLFKKRAGIVLLHAGVILLMVSEMITANYASEGTMTINEGQTINFVIDQRNIELAIEDTSDPTVDDVIIVPEHLIDEAGERVHQEQLPFDIEVVKFMVNSDIATPQPQQGQSISPIATAGFGLDVYAKEKKSVSGVSGEKINVPSVYLKLEDKKTQQSLGTYLFSLNLRPQPLTVDGKTYMVSLRFVKRYIYSTGSSSPISVHLIDFKFDRHVGTNRDRNFSSLVRLIDNGVNPPIDREVKIWMNNPLRYADYAFYQLSFKSDETGTVLQVVHNTGWVVPYVALMIIATGMTAQFGYGLVRFLAKRAKS